MNTTKSLPLLNQQIYDQSPVGMAIATLDGVLIKVNKSFKETLGYSDAELIDKKYTDLLLTEDLEDGIPDISHPDLTDRRFYREQRRFKCKDGSILHVILKLGVLTNSNQQPQFLLAQILNISDKVELINSLSFNERKFREVFENAAIPMAQVRLDSQIYNVNKSFSELLEYSEDELNGMYINDLTHPDDIAINNVALSKILRSGASTHSWEKRYLTKSGKTIHALLKASYIEGKDNEPPHLLGQIVDITSIRAYEAQLKQNNSELRKVNDELDTFIYRASHDLRGPLASMKGIVSLMQVSGNTDQHITDGLNQSIKKLDNTIRQLVAFSGNVQNDIQCVKIDFGTLISETIDLFRPHPNFNKVKFKISIEPELPYCGDITRLRPILNNLINNGLQYISTTRKENKIDVSVAISNKSLKIIVSDNGIGMDDEVKTRALEMFYRGSEQSNGSGLGLYLVKEILNKLKGAIEITSTLGVGTQITITLPVS